MHIFLTAQQPKTAMNPYKIGLSNHMWVVDVSAIEELINYSQHKISF